MCVKSYKWAFIDGFLLWFIPFLAAIPIFPIHTSNPTLFQTLMMIVSVATCVVVVLHYFKKTGENTIKEGFYLGAIWVAINLAFDLPLFLLVFNMPLAQYFTEIGMGYLIYPIITTGFAFATKK